MQDGSREDACSFGVLTLDSFGQKRVGPEVSLVVMYVRVFILIRTKYENVGDRLRFCAWIFNNT